MEYARWPCLFLKFQTLAKDLSLPPLAIVLSRVFKYDSSLPSLFPEKFLAYAQFSLRVKQYRLRQIKG
jgi:hypothetical protein